MFKNSCFEFNYILLNIYLQIAGEESGGMGSVSRKFDDNQQEVKILDA